MNRTLLVVIKTIFIFSGVGLVYGQNNLLNQLNPPTTPQAFHAAGDDPTTSANDSTSSSDASADSAGQSASSDSPNSSNQMSSEEEAAQMANIREIEQKAKSTVNASTMPSPAVTSAVPTSASANFQALQAQIVRLAQMTNSTQQQLSDRLTAVSQQNRQLEKKLASMTKAMQQMQLVINQMGDSSSDTSTAPSPVAGANTKMVQAWKPWLFALSGVVVLLLLLNIYSIWSARHHAARSSGAGELDEEYDFMSTEEAMPAKLDLARAYVQMGDAVQAREVLGEILASKNPDYVAQAKVLMQSLSESEENKHD